MRRFLGIGIAATALMLSDLAHAQRGQQIFDLFLQGAQQELYRQQQLEFEREQRRERDRLYRQYVGQWQACHADDIQACDQALSYPFISGNDRRRLLFKRSEIIAAQQQAAERARRERIEAEYEQRRLQREQQAERDRELARQREDSERERQRAEQAERERQAAEAQLAALRAHTQAREQPRQITASTLAAGAWLPAIAALAIGIPLSLAYVFRDALREGIRRFLATLQRIKFPEINVPPRVAASAPPQPEPSTPAATAPPQAPAEPSASKDGPPPLPHKPRDTPAAIAALELAYAFLEEVRGADAPALDDNDTRKQHLNTLALASRQLDAAQKFDPDAILEGEDEKQTPYRLSINELKAEALLLEGLTHQVYDTKRAIPALVAATKANPNNARAFFVLGLAHAANMNKASAVSAFQRAVALDPKNISYRKELNRAESLTAAEIAGYRATRAGERVFDAGIKTANAGIMVWNIFAITWNIVTFPIRLVFSIFRLLRLAPFA